VLDLSHNNLTFLPQELGMLPSLKCLYLSHNKFGEIPAQDGRWDWIGDIRLARTLEVLDLSHNEVEVGVVSSLAYCFVLLTVLSVPKYFVVQPTLFSCLLVDW